MNNYTHNTPQNVNSLPPNNNWGSFNSQYIPQQSFRIPKRNTHNNGNPNTQPGYDPNSQNMQYQSMIGESYANNYPANGGAYAGDPQQQHQQQSNYVRQPNSNYKSDRFIKKSKQYSNNNQQYNNSNGPGFEHNNQSAVSGDGSFDSDYNGYGVQQDNPNNFNNYNTQQNQSNFKQNKPNLNRKNFKKRGGGAWQGAPRAAPGNDNGLANNQSEFANQNQQSAGNYAPYRKFKEHYSNNQNNFNNDAENNEPAPNIFMGRDDTYPPELNQLLNPFFCGVCNCRLNSIKCANIHYESRAHDKQITNWLKRTFIDNGFTAPELKRYVTEEVVGPYRCEICRLDLTSAQHALQHNNGKRHKVAAAKISPPTGIGYYDASGNWIQTGKIIDKNGKETPYIMVKTPTGVEPVVLHVAPNSPTGVKRAAESQNTTSKEIPNKKSNLVEPKNSQPVVQVLPPPPPPPPALAAAANTQPKTLIVDFKDCSDVRQSPQDALNTQQCNVCRISTTSYDQMLLHLKGIRHTKKLRALGEPPITDWLDNQTSTILHSLEPTNDKQDLSIYRTPTGSYYCKYCNAALPDLARIKKHVSCKNHLAEVKKANQASGS